MGLRQTSSNGLTSHRNEFFFQGVGQTKRPYGHDCPQALNFQRQGHDPIFGVKGTPMEVWQTELSEMRSPCLIGTIFENARF